MSLEFDYETQTHKLYTAWRNVSKLLTFLSH